MFIDFVGLNNFVIDSINGNTLENNGDVQYFYNLDSTLAITASNASEWDGAIGDTRTASKTAIYFWVYYKTSSDSQSNFVYNFGSEDYMCRIRSTGEIQIDTDFTTTNGEYRTVEKVPSEEWTFVLIYHDPTEKGDPEISFKSLSGDTEVIGATFSLDTTPVGDFSGIQTKGLTLGNANSGDHKMKISNFGVVNGGTGFTSAGSKIAFQDLYDRGIDANWTTTDIAVIDSRSDTDFVFYLNSKSDPFDTISNQSGSLSGSVSYLNGANSYFRFLDASFAVPNNVDPFSVLNIHRNGPYGHPIFKQIRASENPLTRYQVANNIFSFVEEPSSQITRQIGDDQVEFISSRYGDIRTFDEVPVSSKYYPLQFLFGVGIDNERIQNRDNLSIPNIERIIINNSFGNEIGHFVNDGINKFYSLSSETEEDYEKIKEFYLDGGLDADDSPVSTFEFLKYKETIFPREVNTYKSHIRQRTNYLNNFWRDIRSDRSEVANNNFGTTLSQSIWPLDAASDWATRSSVVFGAKLTFSDPFFLPTNNSDEGILQNTYNMFADNRTTTSIISVVDQELRSAPTYTRLHTITSSTSVVGPSGIEIDESMGPVFQGTALWEAGQQAGKNPFYSSYDFFIEQLKGKGKDFSIVPEFRISDHVETLLKNGSQTKILDFFEVTGGLANANKSSDTTFYETYSTTDFLKHFAKIKKDHQDFVEPSTIKLTCKALKKFLAYDSFYPAIRTKEMAEQFYDSYKDFIDTESLEGLFPTSNVRFGFQNLLTPLYAPGVLFNSIKAGVACDYPIFTEKPNITQHGKNFFIGSSSLEAFDLRVPFEATIEPEKYLANIQLFNNEPHPSGNVSASCFWDGNGDILYKKMASNFCAETGEFFLNNSSFTSISSLEQSNPNFGQAVAGKPYAMRVKMYRSMDSARSSVSGTFGKYMPPQDFGSGSRETITMYSRPTAFGPPSIGENSNTGVHFDSRDGINFPFTPPYYHGQAFADIEFIPSTTKKYTVNEIIAGSTVKYYRADYHGISQSAEGPTAIGPQANFNIPSAIFPVTTHPHRTFLNKNAMQLNSSLNLFSKGEIKEVNLQNDASSQPVLLTTDVTEDSATRWIIQTKWETPILNFNDVELTVSSSNLESGQTPRGMWHQYGRIPTNEEGIYIAVEDIPRTWTVGALGRTKSESALTGSLADLCGFSSTPVKLGQVASGRVIREAVVAVPFIEIGGEKKFFELDERNIINAKNFLRAEDKERIGETTITGVGDTETFAKFTSPSVIDMVRKARRYVFPPTMDFLNYPEVTPFSMYIFEFTHTLSQEDLSDIWQNLPPDIGESFEESEATVSHPLLANELLGYGTGNDTTSKGGEFPNKLRWMVFKVKQKANTNYFDKIVGVKGSPLADPASSRNKSLKIDQDLISYNWPYDFFSLVELVKIDAEVTFSDLENQNGTTKNVLKGDSSKEKSSRTIEQNPTVESTRNNIGRRGR